MKPVLPTLLAAVGAVYAPTYGAGPLIAPTPKRTRATPKERKERKRAKKARRVGRGK